MRIQIDILSNTYATFEAHFRKKLSNTKLKLKKNVAYKKRLMKDLSEFLLKFKEIGKKSNKY